MIKRQQSINGTIANDNVNTDTNFVNSLLPATVSTVGNVLNFDNKIEKKWYVVDASGLVLGRLASIVAIVLIGKIKSLYISYVNCGDNIIIINADKVVLSGKKMDNKVYYHHSQYPGGLKKTNARSMLKKIPIYLIKHAVKGMLPKNKLGRRIFKNLFVYSGEHHPYKAQKPTQLKIIKEGFKRKGVKYKIW